MTRVYLPATLPLLAALERTGRWDGTPAHAVTPALREHYTEGDLEELEYAALLDAAEASLRLLAADPAAPRRRVVLAAEVADTAVRPDASQGTASAAVLTGPLDRSAVVSVHVDDDSAVDDVAAAAEALPAADAGDDDAAFTVSGAEGHDLLWYDVTEIADLVG